MRRYRPVLCGLLPILGVILSACSWGPTVDYIADPPPVIPLPEAGILSDGGVGPVSFATQIRPLINRADGPTNYGCKRCHDPSQPDPQGFQQAGLDLSTLGHLRSGGVSSGRRIVIPGNPDESAIIQKLEGTYYRGARMPKDRTPWSREEIALLRRWILEGAPGEDSE